MAASIEVAHQVGPAAWEVTLNYYAPFIRLNVGSILAFSVEPTGAYVALTPDPLPTEVEAQVKALQLSSDRFKVVDLRLLGFKPEDLRRIWESIRDAHVGAIKAAASSYERSPYARSHSPGVVDHLKTVVGHELPSPTYSGNGRGVQDLVQLMEKRYPNWTGFEDPRFVEDERTYKPVGEYGSERGARGAFTFDVDAVLSDQQGQPLAVLDAKYKAPEKASNDDVYQVVTYAETLGCHQGALVYPTPLDNPLDESFGRNRVRSLVFRLDGDLETAGKAFWSDWQSGLPHVTNACGGQKA
jgi:hypothetical protein